MVELPKMATRTKSPLVSEETTSDGEKLGPQNWCHRTRQSRPTADLKGSGGPLASSYRGNRYGVSRTSGRQTIQVSMSSSDELFRALT